MFGQILGSVVGGLLGGGGSESSQTSNKIDDRLAPYIYGKDGKGGLLSDVQSLYRQQMGQGGLNEMQRAGMESQRQVYASPQFTQGYDAMRSQGMGLLGAGVSQNPFTSGMPMMGAQAGDQQYNTTQVGAQRGDSQYNMPSVVRPNTNMQYQPYQPQQTPSYQGMNTPVQSVAQYQAAQPAPAPAPTTSEIDDAIDAYMKANGLGKYAGQQLGINGQPFFDGA